jgi:type I restriction-modification system DNA methylase subunit
MPISWNEIKTRAVTFTNKWKEESKERAEKDSFWNDFFDVFGISRYRVATFEKSVKKSGGGQGYIDLFWKGQILIEHKSKGKSLEKAFEQAKDYFPGLKENELPKYILVCDFENFHLYNLGENTEHKFTIHDFLNNVHLFGFIAGYKQRVYKDEDPVNIDAAELMGKLHDRLEEVGYTGHALEIYLVRLLFCLFAEDTNIFEKGIFAEYIDIHTKEDGSDLAMHLAEMFQILNTPRDKRLSNINESLDQFPYVNGQLFAEQLPFASFDSKMREMLLDTCDLDWGKISPAIFGSMFQSVMNPEERRNLGAHYTSEKNILKLIKPLFLDELKSELKKAKGNKNKLLKLQKKISTLKFLDPACGCGNFLIITYRELRLLELEILKQVYGGQQVFSIEQIVLVDIDQFYGIEYDEFAVRIGEVAMWLIDHQMNMKISEAFGDYFVRLPLRKSVNISHGNALRTDWEFIVSKKELNFILGNPPFIGKNLRDKTQNEDFDLVFHGVKNYKSLDYVTAWYVLAAQYIQGTLIQAAFVSTNSISQGEQVSVLWNELFYKYKIKIHFAHRTFEWKNEAKGNAAVHVVIVCFGNFDIKSKKLTDYETIRSDGQELIVNNINGYLIPSKDIVINSRSTPISNLPPMKYGSKPVDGGFYMFTTEEKNQFILEEPNSKDFFKKIIGSKEYINNIERWCLWLKDISPKDLKSLPKVLERVNAVKKMRLASKKKATQETAKTPTLFAEFRQPSSNFIIFPLVSSINRPYIPLGFLTNDYIVNNRCSIIPNAKILHLGFLLSEMHMAWTRAISGRMKSDFNYSTRVVYNNFPLPTNVSDKKKEKIEKTAQKILDVRAKYPKSSLADLYDPLTMPPDLVKAHQALDKAVDLCYRSHPFSIERSRVEFLFDLYEQSTIPLLKTERKKGKI